MESLLDRTSDADLDQLLRELASRRYGNKRRSVRLQAWRLTVRSSYAMKRTIDVFGSLVGMILLSPVFLGIALAVKLTSPGPVIFAQVRVGRYGRHFRFYKFRSMYVDAEERKKELLAKNESKDGVIFKMKDDPRITKVGKFLRRTSLDELPQLWNVFIGDMSLVGPRPPVPSEVAQYTLEDRKRLDRVAHTIKGNALAAGDNAMAETAISLRKASALKNCAEADALISRLRELQKEL